MSQRTFEMLEREILKIILPPPPPIDRRREESTRSEIETALRVLDPAAATLFLSWVRDPNAKGD